MAGGSGALTLLTVFGVVSFVSGVIVRAVALRRALLFAPAPVPAGVRPVPSPVTPRFGPRSADTLRRVPAGTPTRRRGLSRPAAPAPPRIRRRLVTEDRLLFLACFMLYLACGVVLAFNFDSFYGDAQARVANVFHVLFSRDPHLAAIGFVWSPLPSFLLLPVLPLKVLWPALVTRAFAGIIEIALCMAGAVCVLHGILRDLRLSRPVGLLITALFALNPMVVYHGAN